MKIPSGIELYNAIASKFKPLSSPCPSCRSRGQMERHDSYDRYLIDYDGAVETHTVEVERAKCAACGHTHAALADVLVPYKSYCILFILKVMKEYFHTRAATSICRKYGIAVSTLYEWRDRYLMHASLDLFQQRVKIPFASGGESHKIGMDVHPSAR
jgi:transposase